ncbi:MAG: hypothetical protein E4H03_06870 [Myxococcales bacterium]|nr:MAG: hypothetical protein E4H03_06870 [Myxococcales bacterium]
MASIIPTRIIRSVAPEDLTPRAVGREFRELLDRGAKLKPAGEARRDPQRLLDGYRPKHRIDLFDTTLYLTNPLQNPELRFFVAYVVQHASGNGRPVVSPRIFYKDISLVWRAASHFVHTKDELWIGKGDVEEVVINGEEMIHSSEQTTDLPLELQNAVEVINHDAVSVRRDWAALGLVLRNAPSSRIAPYSDFTDARRRAMSNPRNLIYRGRRVVTFARAGDPTSLRIVRGFEPDFSGGVVERFTSSSKLYRGNIHRYRILSTNHEIQWRFMAAPKHAWIVPPQALTTELSSFGVRTVDVLADDHLFVPGYEYHFMDDSVDPPALHSQIPKGFVAGPCPNDDTRADAAPWLDALPIIRDFRRLVLVRKRPLAVALMG